MSPRSEEERLSVSRLRVLWTVMKARPQLLVPEWGRRWLVPMAAGIAVAAVVAALVPAVLPAVAAGLVAGGAATALQLADPDESRLPPANDELHRLIAEVAAELRVRRPRRVYVWAHPEAMALRVAPWRNELRENGHTYAHPLARRILIAQDGARLDVAALAAEVAAGT